jgi:hypothetical protein
MQHTNRETKYPKCFALYFQFNFLLSYSTRLRQAQADNLQLLALKLSMVNHTFFQERMIFCQQRVLFKIPSYAPHNNTDEQ